MAMHDTFSSPNGWNGMLEHFAQVTSQRAATAINHSRA
jgi:hypothetical protein